MQLQSRDQEIGQARD